MSKSPPEVARRYWVFEFENYYPSGGMHDFAGCYDTLDEIPENARGGNQSDRRRDNQQVIDIVTMMCRRNDGEWEPVERIYTYIPGKP